MSSKEHINGSNEDNLRLSQIEGIDFAQLDKIEAYQIIPQKSLNNSNKQANVGLSTPDSPFIAQASGRTSAILSPYAMNEGHMIITPTLYINNQENDGRSSIIHDNDDNHSRNSLPSVIGTDDSRYHQPRQFPPIPVPQILVEDAHTTGNDPILTTGGDDIPLTTTLNTSQQQQQQQQDQQQKNQDTPSGTPSGSADPNTPNNGQNKDTSLDYDESQVIGTILQVGLFDLFRYSTRFDKFIITIAILTSMASGAVMPSMAILIGLFVERVANPADLLANVSEICKILLYIGIGSAVVSYLSISLWTMAAERQCRSIRYHYLLTLTRAEIAYHDAQSLGEIIVKLVSTDKIRVGIGQGLGQIVQSVFGFIVGIGIAFYYGWALALVIIACVPVLLIFAAVMTGLVSKKTEAEQGHAATAGGIASQTFNSMTVVKALCLEDWQLYRYISAQSDWLDVSIKKAFLQGSTLGGFMLIIFSLYSIGWYVGAVFIRDGKASWPGSVYNGATVLTIFYALVLSVTILGGMTTQMSSLGTAKVAAYPLFETIDRASPIDPFATEGKHINPQDFTGSIKCDLVGFQYPSRQAMVLLDLDLHFKPGYNVLIGGSGCGKSTVLQLVSRYYDPDVGDVMIEVFDDEERVGSDDEKSPFCENLANSHLGLITKLPVTDSPALKPPTDTQATDKPTQQPITTTELTFNVDGTTKSTQTPRESMNQNIVNANSSADSINIRPIPFDSNSNPISPQKPNNNNPKFRKTKWISASSLHIHSYRNLIAVCHQEPVVFEGSIKENLFLGRPDATDEEMFTVLDYAGLLDFTQQLPNRLEQHVSSRVLSGGQQQRLCFARALLADKPILLLDEFCASLDTKTSAIVHKGLDNWMKNPTKTGMNKTVISVTHKLSTVRSADQIFALSKGHVIQSGTHSELYRQEEGYYRRLLNEQSAFEDDQKKVYDQIEEVKLQIKRHQMGLPVFSDVNTSSDTNGEFNSNMIGGNPNLRSSFANTSFPAADYAGSADFMTAAPLNDRSSFMTVNSRQSQYFMSMLNTNNNHGMSQERPSSSNPTQQPNQLMLRPSNSMISGNFRTIQNLSAGKSPIPRGNDSLGLKELNASYNNHSLDGTEVAQSVVTFAEHPQYDDRSTNNSTNSTPRIFNHTHQSQSGQYPRFNNQPSDDNSRASFGPYQDLGFTPSLNRGNTLRDPFFHPPIHMDEAPTPTRVPKGTPHPFSRGRAGLGVDIPDDASPRTELKSQDSTRRSIFGDDNNTLSNQHNSSIPMTQGKQNQFAPSPRFGPTGTPRVAHQNVLQSPGLAPPDLEARPSLVAAKTRSEFQKTSSTLTNLFGGAAFAAHNTSGPTEESETAYSISTTKGGSKQPAHIVLPKYSNQLLIQDTPLKMFRQASMRVTMRPEDGSVVVFQPDSKSSGMYDPSQDGRQTAFFDPQAMYGPRETAYYDAQTIQNFRQIANYDTQSQQDTRLSIFYDAEGTPSQIYNQSPISPHAQSSGVQTFEYPNRPYIDRLSMNQSIYGSARLAPSVVPGTPAPIAEEPTMDEFGEPTKKTRDNNALVDTDAKVLAQVAPKPKTTSIVAPVLKHLFPFLLKYPVLIILGIISCMGEAATTPAYALLLKYVLDAFFLDAATMMKKAQTAAILFFCIGLAYLVFGTLRVGLLVTAGEKITHDIRKLAFRIITFQELGTFFDLPEHSQAVLSTLLANDVEQVRVVVSELVADVVICTAMLIISIGISFGQGWHLTLLVIGLLPFLVGCSVIQHFFLTRSSQSKQLLDAPTQDISECLTHIRVIATYRQEQYVVNRFMVAANKYCHSESTRGQIAGVWTGLSSFVVLGAYSLIFWFGGWLITKQHLQPMGLIQIFTALQMSAGAMSSKLANAAMYSAALQHTLAIFNLIHFEKPSAKVYFATDEQDEINAQGIRDSVSKIKGSQQASSAPTNQLEYKPRTASSTPTQTAPNDSTRSSLPIHSTSNDQDSTNPSVNHPWLPDQQSKPRKGQDVNDKHDTKLKKKLAKQALLGNKDVEIGAIYKHLSDGFILDKIQIGVDEITAETKVHDGSETGNKSKDQAIKVKTTTTTDDAVAIDVEMGKMDHTDKVNDKNNQMVNTTDTDLIKDKSGNPLPKHHIISNQIKDRLRRQQEALITQFTSYTISFSGIYFAYPTRPQQLVFNDMNLVIPGGKYTCIVGTSGSGKSSILSLILRLYDPTPGHRPLQSSFHGPTVYYDPNTIFNTIRGPLNHKFGNSPKDRSGNNSQNSSQNNSANNSRNHSRQNSHGDGVIIPFDFNNNSQLSITGGQPTQNNNSNQLTTTSPIFSPNSNQLTTTSPIFSTSPNKSSYQSGLSISPTSPGSSTPQSTTASLRRSTSENEPISPKNLLGNIAKNSSPIGGFPQFIIPEGSINVNPLPTPTTKAHPSHSNEHEDSKPNSFPRTESVVGPLPQSGMMLDIASTPMPESEGDMETASVGKSPFDDTITVRGTHPPVPTIPNFNQSPYPHLSSHAPSTITFATPSQLSSQPVMRPIGAIPPIPIIDYTERLEPTGNFCELQQLQYESGSITIDGVDIRTLTNPTLRGIIGFVSQFPILFTGTIMDNLKCGREIDDQTAIDACKMAHIHEVIMSLPDQYGTILGGTQSGLSGGQRARLSLARTLILNQPILLLDEINSALDAESATAINEALDRYVKGKTVILIAHRLDLVAKSDHIIVLHSGKVVEQGHHDKLMKLRNGLYKDLYQASMMEH